jgi:hypothetical protein
MRNVFPIILFVLVILSLILIIIIELEWGFIPCDRYKELNSITVILSSGYFGSYIVYFLTIVIPEYEDRKRTKEARKKMFIISTSFVRSKIIAQIRGGITSSKEITIDELCSNLKETPLYNRFVNARNNESLCESIWRTYQYFSESFLEFCILWNKYLDSESLVLIAEIKDSDFYRCLNHNFSLYNTQPISLPNGNKECKCKVVDANYEINEQNYDYAVKILMVNLISLIELINKLEKRIV